MSTSQDDPRLGILKTALEEILLNPKYCVDIARRALAKVAETEKREDSPDDRRPLTDRQAMVLDFISSYTEANGWPPTTREISKHLGSTSVNTAVVHLRALTKKGYIRRGTNVARGIEIIPAATS